MIIDENYVKLTIRKVFNNPDIRVRVRKGFFQDEIRLGVFDERLLSELEFAEIKWALDNEYLNSTQVAEPTGLIRTVYVYPDAQCKQAVFYKRWFQAGLEFIRAIFFRNFS